MLQKLSLPFPFYLGDDRRNLLLILGISSFLLLFLAGVHVTDMAGRHSRLAIVGKISMISGVTFGVLLGTILGLPRLFPQYFDSQRWTLGKYLILCGIQLFLVGTVSSSILSALGFYNGAGFFAIAMLCFPKVLLYGIGPMIIVTLIINTKMVNENLRSAIRANQELERIRVLKTERPPAHLPLTIYSDTSETLTLKLPDLLFVEADDNYSTFYWMNGHGLEKKMLRVNLSNIESQLSNAFTIRCHRSYIVNINRISHVTGNANGYKVAMKDVDLSVPVSRSKGKEVLEKIHQLRNSIEIS